MLAEILIILALIVANGLFAAAEIALLSVRKTRLKELIEEGRSGAQTIRALREKPERLLATVQIGITVVSAAAAAFGGAAIAARLEPGLRRLGLGHHAAGVALAIVVAGVSYFSLILGELVPKSLALRSAERYALALGRPLALLAWLLRPLVWLLVASSNLVLRMFDDHTSFSEARLSPEELQQLVEEAAKTGSLDPQAGEIASRAFDFSSLSVREVMVPRHRIIGIPRGASADEVQRILLEKGHTRMPVYDGTIENIIGFVIVKDILSLAWQGPLVILEDLIRAPLFVPESLRALDLLRMLQKKRTQLAIVVDDQGTVAGLITMEDLVEEVVGEIFNEHEAPVELIKHEADGSAVVQGTAHVRDVNRELALQLPEGESYPTLAGLVIEMNGWIPKAGTSLKTKDGVVLEVVEASPRRVRTVRIRRTEPPPVD